MENEAILFHPSCRCMSGKFTKSFHSNWEFELNKHACMHTVHTNTMYNMSWNLHWGTITFCMQTVYIFPTWRIKRKNKRRQKVFILMRLHCRSIHVLEDLVPLQWIAWLWNYNNACTLLSDWIIKNYRLDKVCMEGFKDESDNYLNANRCR